MKRRIILVASVSLVLLLGALVVVMLASGRSGRRVTVSFVNSEPSNGSFPNYEKSERLAFDVRNAGSKAASVVAFTIENGQGYQFPRSQMLADVEAGQSERGYLYLPPTFHPTSVRIRVIEEASKLYKTRRAAGVAAGQLMGRSSGQPVWINKLRVVADEFTVSVVKESQPNGAVEPTLPINSSVDNYR